MDVGCNCLNVATAAKVPVKRYNLLVPALFPVAEPSATKPLGIGVEKNIKKVGEYLERNEHRIPKVRRAWANRGRRRPCRRPGGLTAAAAGPQVSRRLARRLQRELRRGRMGYVRVAVATFSHLARDGGGRYARLYVPELVGGYPVRTNAAHKTQHPPPCSHPLQSRLFSAASSGRCAPRHSTSPDAPPRPAQAKRRRVWGCGRGPRFPEPHLGSAVGLLLSSASPLAQMWGLDLLSDLLQTQHSAESVGQLEAMVPLLSRRAAAPAAAGADADAGGVAAAALRTLLEHLRLCARASCVSRHLDAVTYAVLGALEAAGPAAVDGPGAAQHAAGAAPAPAATSVSLGARVGASSPGVAALLVCEELGRLTVDAAEGRKVLQFLLRFLDAAPARWLGGPAAGAGLAAMRSACARGHQRYLLFSALAAHVAGAPPALGPAHRRAVLAAAAADGAALDPDMAAPALLLALQELPPALAPRSQGPSGGGEWAALEAEVEGAVRGLARRAGSRMALTAALGLAAGRVPAGAPWAAAALRCCAAAAEAYAGLPPAGKPAAGAAAPPPRHLSDVLLRSLLRVCVGWGADARLQAHAVLGRAMAAAAPAAPAPPQAAALLSALWHEAALPDNAPASYAALEACLGSVVGGGGAGALDPALRAQACQLAEALQEEAAAGGGRLAGAAPAQRCALLATSAAMWRRLAAALEAPQLASRGVPGVENGGRGLERRALHGA